MDYKKSKAPVNTVSRNIMDLCNDTENIYESVAIIAKRANQISMQIKEDLSKKLAEFASYNDSLEEVRSYRSPHCWLPRSLSRVRSIGATPHRSIRRRTNPVLHLIVSSPCGSVNRLSFWQWRSS